MRTYQTVIIPMEHIKAAIGELKDLNASWREWHEEREKWRVDDAVRIAGGVERVEEHKRELEAIDQKQRERIEAARGVIERERAACVAEIDE